MKNWEKKLIGFRGAIMMACKGFLLAVTVYVFYYGFHFFYPEATFFFKGNIVFAGVYGFLFATFLFTYGGLRIGASPYRDLFFSYTLSAVLTSFAAYFFICLLAMEMLRVYPICIMLAVQLVSAAFLYWLFLELFSKLNPPLQTVAILVEESDELNNLERAFYSDPRYTVQCVLFSKDCMDGIASKIKDYDAIILGDVDQKLRREILYYAYQEGIKVLMLPSMEDVIAAGAVPVMRSDVLVFNGKRHRFSPDQLALKRMMDLIVASLMLLLSLPLCLIAIIGIKLTDGGPILYRQERLTRNGKSFMLYKFRSMIVDAEKGTGAVLAKQGDARITGIGRFIRATRIDELPQLINILKGDMTLVGPRPERPEMYEKICQEFPEFRMRLAVKAGLTGYAQLYGKYNTSFANKAKMDLYYIENASFLMDLKLLCYTLKIIFVRESTEGVVAEKKATSKEECL